MKNLTGENKIEDFQKNKLIIKGWFEANPNSTAKRCSIKVGLSYKTVLNHIKKLQGKITQKEKIL